MAESEEVLQLRRRARRRLLGATALVLLLVIVPPWLMDREPRPVTSNLSVEIPPKDPGKQAARGAIPTTETSPPATPTPEISAQQDHATAPPAPPTGIPKSAGVGTEPRKSQSDETQASQAPRSPPAKPETRDAGKGAKESVARAATGDAARAESLLKNEVFFIQVGAFSNQDNARQVQQKIEAAGLKSFTDTTGSKGDEQTRVRVGPFSSREAAEKAREKVVSLGFKPGPVQTR